jgi:hypothetical protein
MTGTTQVEKWLDVRGYEGLYQLSNYGRVRNCTVTGKGRFIGNWYSCILFSGSTHISKACSISTLLMEHFGTVERVVYTPIELRKKSGKNIPTERYPTLEEVNEKLNNIWNACSGETPQYENYLLQYDMTLEQVLDSVCVHIGCNLCCTVLNYPLFEVEWSNLKYTVVSEGHLTLQIIRYFLQKKGKIEKKTGLRISNLYDDEVDTFRKVVSLILGFNEKWKYELNSEEMEEDEDEENNDLKTHRQFQQGNNRNGENSVDRRKFMQRPEVESDNSIELPDLNMVNFTTEISDTRLATKIYNLLPVSWKGEFRPNIKDKQFDEMFSMCLENLYPEFSLSEILSELAEFQTPELFNYFKKLSEKHQKMIIKEIKERFRIT